ncbi:hypothetical protein JCM10212_003224 [Sporobolomyces blumeae]
MPFTQIDEYKVNLFWLMNPDPRDLASASHDNLPPSKPIKEGFPTIVFLHAAASNICGWSRQLSDPRLANNFNLLAIDCMYNGWTTGGEEGDYTLEDSASVVVACLDKLELTEYHLFGEGVHGCVIAAWVAVKRRSCVKSLLIASPGYRQEAPDVLAALAAVQDALLCNKVGRGGDDTGTFPSQPLSDIVAYFIGSLDRLAGAREEMRIRFQERYGRDQPLHEVKWLFDAVMERKAIPDELLGEVRCPVLILRGSEDTVVSPEHACEEWRRAFSNAAGGASCHVIAGAPSLISLSDANIVNRICTQFCLRAK